MLQPLGNEGQCLVEQRRELDPLAARAARVRDLEQRVDDPRDARDLLLDRLEPPLRIDSGDVALEHLGVALDHAHRGADFVREPGHEGGDRRELLRGARARGGLLERETLLAQAALEDAALARELVGQIREALLVALDVRLDRHLHVERHPRSQRSEHSGGFVEIVELSPHDRGEEGEIEHCEADRPFRTETRALLGNRRAFALAQVVVTEVRIGVRHHVVAPPGEEPLLRVGLQEQPPGLRKQQQLPMECVDDSVDVGLEHWAQLGEQIQIVRVEPEIGQPLLDRLLRHPRRPSSARFVPLSTTTARVRPPSCRTRARLCLCTFAYGDGRFAG